MTKATMSVTALADLLGCCSHGQWRGADDCDRLPATIGIKGDWKR